jgi:predicted anti-sigma-YlaC factor YlaD
MVQRKGTAMICSDIQEQVSSLIDNELYDDVSKHVFVHLSECHECRGFLRTAMQLRSALSMGRPPSASPILDERVLSIPLESARQATGKRRFAAWLQGRLTIPVPAMAVVIALTVLTTVLSVVLWSRQYRPQDLDKATVVYVIGMQPIEVQGASVSSNREIQ